MVLRRHDLKDRESDILARRKKVQTSEQSKKIK